MKQGRRARGPAAPVAAAALALLGAAGISALASAHELARTICAACHGADGNSVAPNFPRLAGLQPEYITKQLQDYLAGKRKSDVMAPMLVQVNASDIPALAAYFAALKPGPGTKPADEKLAAAGKALYEDGNTATGVPACAGCHQEGGVGNERYPRIAGQHGIYTTAQMMAFKTGARTNDRARVMRAVAERLSEQEIAALAEYLAGL
ncbi:MAG: c-type cytochrome [Rubrivivax sp.]